MRAYDIVNEDEPVRIKLSGNNEAAKAWIQKVYAKYPGTFQNNHVMTWGEGDAQQFAMFELVPSFSRRGAVEVKWFQAYPLRQGVGSRAMKELQALAREDGIELTLFPWDKGVVSQSKLTKFYKGQGFKPIQKGGKSMYWAQEKVAEDSYQPPSLEVGDKILKGKFKNSPAEIKGFTKDKHNQPVLKTNKGPVQLFKPRIVKLVKEEINPDILQPGFKHKQEIDGLRYTATHRTGSGVAAAHKQYLHICCYDGREMVGYVMFQIYDNAQTKNKHLESEMVYVDPSHRKRNIAYTMYTYARMLGNTIEPSYRQTTPGQNMWAAWTKSGDAKHLMKEGFNQPYPIKWEKSDYGDYDAFTKLPDGTPLSIMFSKQQDSKGQEAVHVEFYRSNSQEVSGEGDAQRIFATVLNATQQYIKKHKPLKLFFSAAKLDPTANHEPGAPHTNPESRAKLYTRLVQRYAGAWGYNVKIQDEGSIVRYELSKSLKEAADSAEKPMTQCSSQDLQKLLGRGKTNALIRHPWFQRYNNYEHAFKHGVDRMGFTKVEVYPFFSSVHTTSEGKLRPLTKLEFTFSYGGTKVVQVEEWYRAKEPDDNERRMGPGAGWRHMKTWATDKQDTVDKAWDKHWDNKAVKEEELTEYEHSTAASDKIIAKLKSLGYEQLGGGLDATVWSRDAGSVVKILMPSRTIPGRVSDAERGFLTFYEFCQEHDDSPNLPKFVDIGGAHHTVFEIDDIPYRQIAMERLQPLTPNSFESYMIGMLADLAKMGAPWSNIVNMLKRPSTWASIDGVVVSEEEMADMVKQKFADPDTYKHWGMLYITIGRLYRAGLKAGLGWDLHGENVMQRADGTVVITDPYFT